MKYQIHQDDQAQNPRIDMDCVGEVVLWGNKHVLGDSYPECTPAEFKESAPKGSIILPVFIYDHSGIRLSTRSFLGRAPHAEWDSCQIGFIYATPEMIESSMPEATDAEVISVLEAEIDMLDCYVSGHVYYYEITDDDGEVLDACYGFYGYEYCESEAKAALEQMENNQQ